VIFPGYAAKAASKAGLVRAVARLLVRMIANRLIAEVRRGHSPERRFTLDLLFTAATVIVAAIRKIGTKRSVS
jgi:spore maturation protein SpmA